MFMEFTKSFWTTVKVETVSIPFGLQEIKMADKIIKMVFFKKINEFLSYKLKKKIPLIHDIWDIFSIFK
jgi:hypothetical protein